MISPLGTKGNLSVTCDVDACVSVYNDRRHRDLTDLSDYTEEKVRRQARRRGWTTLGTGVALRDVCPIHPFQAGLIYKTRC